MSDAIQDPKAELAALRQARAERELAHKAKTDLLELEELRLEDKLARELGLRGIDFEICVSNAGELVAMRRDLPTGGSATIFKRWQAALTTPETAEQYVTPFLVHTTLDSFASLLEREPHMVLRCANALQGLHGAGEAVKRGKF